MKFLMINTITGLKVGEATAEQKANLESQAAYASIKFVKVEEKKSDAKTEAKQEAPKETASKKTPSKAKKD